MSSPRLLAPECIPHPIYHCYSRIVDRRYIFRSPEKQKFLQILRSYETLCGVRILTYCLMSNHFHILVEVPRRPAKPPGESELISLIERSLGPRVSRSLADRLHQWREQNNEAAITGELERWYAQMWDLGRFMKMVKQRFSCWYNRQQPGPRTGTLWESRYRSTLVESGLSLQTIALYIDLNPVRAGLVADPLHYRWCGYAAAAAGVEAACRGLVRMTCLSSPSVASEAQDASTSASRILAWYRHCLHQHGAAVKNNAGEVIRHGFTRAAIDAVRDAEGNLPLHAYLLHRVRYFTQGAIIGTSDFVDTVFKERREWFSGKRRSGARRLKGLARDCPLRCARDLCVRPFG